VLSVAVEFAELLIVQDGLHVFEKSGIDII
jgi:hypothetical protein